MLDEEMHNDIEAGPPSIETAVLDHHVTMAAEDRQKAFSLPTLLWPYYTSN